MTILTIMRKDRIRWADEFPLEFVGDGDRNVIGMTWLKLARAGIVQRMDHHRRSTAKSARGRTVWKYWLSCPEAAERFLADAGGLREPGQPDLFGAVLNGDKK